jgi:hypothetical protein
MYNRLFSFLFLLFIGYGITSCSHKRKVEQSPSEISSDHEKANKHIKRSYKRQLKKSKRERARKGGRWAKKKNQY